MYAAAEITHWSCLTDAKEPYLLLILPEASGIKNSLSKPRFNPETSAVHIEGLTLLHYIRIYRGADKFLARPTSRYVFLMVRIFLLMLVLLYIYIYIYIYSTNIPPIMIINRTYENQNLLSL